MKNDEALFKEIGKRLRKLRLKEGYTLETSSNFSGVSLSYIAEIEKGIKAPSISMLRTLLEFYEISFSKFFKGL